MKRELSKTALSLLIAATVIIGMFPQVTASAKSVMPFNGKKVLTSSSGILGSGTTITIRPNGKFTTESASVEYNGQQTYYFDYGHGSFTSVKGSGKKYTMKYKPVKYKTHSKEYTKGGAKYHETHLQAYFNKGQKFTLYAPGYKVSKLPKRVTNFAKELVEVPAIFSSDYTMLNKTHGYILDGGNNASIFFESVKYVAATPVSDIEDGIYASSTSMCKVFKKRNGYLTVTLDDSLEQPYFEKVISGNTTKATKFRSIKFKLSDDCKWSDSGVMSGTMESCTKDGHYNAYSYDEMKSDIASCRRDEWDAGIEFVVRDGLLRNVVVIFS